MTKNELAILLLGLLLGLGAGLVIAMPELRSGACPKGLTGLLLCPKEWQTLSAGALALLAGTAAYIAARHTTTANAARERGQRERQVRSLARSLAAEFRYLETRAASAAVYAKTADDTRESDTFNAARLRRRLDFKPNLLESDFEKIGAFNAAVSTHVMRGKLLLEVLHRNAMEWIEDMETASKQQEPDAEVMQKCLDEAVSCMEVIDRRARYFAYQLTAFSNADDLAVFQPERLPELDL